MSRHSVLESLPEISPTLEKLYKELHQHPELSMLETKTRTRIREQLNEYGYDTMDIGGGSRDLRAGKS